MKSLNFLPLNAIKYVALSGLFEQGDNGSGLGSHDAQGIDDVAWEFEQVLPAEAHCMMHKAGVREKGPPVRPPSTLPPPGSLRVLLQVKECIGYGRLGTVYAVDVSRLDNRTGGYLPPLVIKVSKGSLDCSKLSKEAGLYTEMQSLQGTVVPRCYGLFTSQVPDGCAIRDFQLEQTGSSSEQEEHQQLHDAEDNKDCISILLLERLGRALHPDNHVPNEAKKDIYAMFNEVAKLGILHDDIRADNILEAPSHPEVSSTPSPLSGRTYGWRIIDWEFADKTNCLEESIDRISRTALSVMFKYNDFPAEASPTAGPYVDHADT
ncbi:unnamed protein product [Cyclocybe aegerita]|uniref:Protein kinase domain-containing protein n=1 Tax=Cyclocybe aegerita TaxID=1973307 RepID=A0A8S0WTV9_CYCAE|nr:unnamed protein product [Cyclocybe aegerita]